jgi:putative ABC transport system permease protein
MLFRRGHAEQDLDDEICDYIERETQDNIAAGMPPAEALQAAQRKFGRPVLNIKEDTRAVWGWVWLERLWQDLCHGSRMLAKNPGFTFIAVSSLAIGIGINSAIFSLADALLLRPLAISHPAGVVTVDSTNLTGASRVSYRDYIDFRDHSRSFSGLIAGSEFALGFSKRPDAVPRMTMGMLVSGNFFSVLGVEPALGRTFLPQEDQEPGRDAVVVLSHELWVEQFAADPAIIGHKVRLSGIDFTVIGVVPEKFTGIDLYVHPSLYVPLMMSPRIITSSDDHLLESRSRRDLIVKGRLKPSVTLNQARAELQVIAKDLERSYPDTNRNVGALVNTELQERFRQDAVDSQLSAMLLALAAAVLLVACANVAGLLLSRSRVRSREIALRLAIGAGRPRLVRQLLTESVLIAVAGGVLGIAAAYAGVSYLSRLEVPSDLPIRISVQLDHRALLVCLAAAVISSLLFGLAPALQTTRLNLVDALKTAGADTPAHRRLLGRHLLVIGQITASMALLLVAGTLYDSFRSVLNGGPGYRTDHLLMMSFDPSLVRYSQGQSQEFFKQLAVRAANAAGAKSVALASVIPMGTGQDGISIVPEGYQFPKGKENVDVMSSSINEGYFDIMHIPIVSGRAFRATDTATSPQVAIVNQELAGHYWPGQSPIGKRFRLDDRKGPWFEIVGVAKTTRYLWFAEPPTEFVYLALTQHPRQRVTLLAESFGDPASLVTPLREVVRGIDAGQPIFDVRTMEDLYRVRAVENPNMIIETIAAMGLVGLILALVGLYGLVSYSTGRRTREIGIRMAIGGQRVSVLRMVMRQGLRLALIGIGTGLIVGFGAEKTMNAILSDTQIDWRVYLFLAPLMLAITLLAAYFPARRASRVDPMRALRYE